MVFYCIVSAFSFFLLLTLGIRILQDSGGKLSLLLGIYTLIAAYVSAIELLVRLSESRGRAAFWGSGAFLWPFAPATFLHFAIVATFPAGRWRNRCVLMDYSCAALLSFFYFRYFQSGQALTWRYGWTLTSPFYFNWPWIIFTGLTTLYILAPLLLFLFRVFRPGGILAPREQRWILIAYGLRFVISAVSPLVSRLLGQPLPELNSAAYAVFALFLYVGISRSYILSLTPQRAVGLILSSMEEFLFLTTPQLTIVFANRPAQRLVGEDSGSIQGKSIAKLFGLAEGEPLPEELCYRDGSRTWRALQMTSTEVGSPAGVPAGYVFLGRDVSEARHREAALRETVATKELVLQELHHRVYNTLQTVISLLHLKVSGAVGTETEEALTQCAHRVERMAQVYRGAHQSTDFAAVRFDELLEQLSIDIYQSHFGRQKVKLDVHAEPVELNIRQAIPLLLIAGELIANAFTHAFPDERNGSIQIGFQALGSSEWELLVSDDGVGIQPNRPTEQGGLLMAGALADQAGATISFDGGPGTAVRVKIASL